MGNPITEKEKLADQWRTVFFIAAGVYGVGSLFYLFAASGEKQSWASGVRSPNSVQQRASAGSSGRGSW